MIDRSCPACKHFNDQKWGTCKAFPDGIPFEILSGEFKHDQPHKNDGGIRFETVRPQEGRNA